MVVLVSLKVLLSSHFIMRGCEGLEAMTRGPGSNAEPEAFRSAVKSDPLVRFSLHVDRL